MARRKRVLWIQLPGVAVPARWQTASFLVDKGKL
jgi:hypothetical protein